ncbi:MAG: phosphatase PAP2 family protein [Deltaproteobacteria bacterium]|nr:phosphatase PAP2 family protein [Deltaproteobacteria bacterium]
MPVEHRYRLEEIAIFAMLALLNLLILVFARSADATLAFYQNCALAAAVFAVARLHRYRGGMIIAFIRDWYVLPLLLFIYMEHKVLIPLINPHDVDDLLIILDRLLFFGHDPTVLMEKIMLPPLTELAQIVYASFYFLPLTLCVLAWRRDREVTFHVVASTILIGFFVSYAGYYLTPALGPRFTLAHLQGAPLTGVLTFDIIRSSLDAAEGIMRDCCPSGHVMISMLTILLARRIGSRFFIPVIAWTLLLSFSTVYLRYHYVVDLIAGVGLAFVVHLFVPAIERFVVSRK